MNGTDIEVLYEDERVLAVAKPAGVPSVEHARGEPSALIAWLLAHRPVVAGIGEGPRPAGQVHRLDTGTSGVLLIAKSREVHAALREQFSTPGAVEKSYEALLEGEPAGTLEIAWPIGARGRRSKKVVVARTGREAERLRAVQPARTTIGVIRACPRATHAAITIATGVRHQIRAHAAAAGHPVLGDELYGSADALAEGCEHRLYLHAASLSLILPGDKTPTRIACPLPKSFGRCFALLCDEFR